MKIKEVCSLELAKELKELGAKQKSYWFWQWHCVSGKYFLKTKEEVDKSIYPFQHFYSAYTVAELCEGLPARIKTDYGSWSYLHITKLENTKEWLIGYYHDEIKESTLANACAKMRIHLLKNNLIEK